MLLWVGALLAVLVISLLASSFLIKQYVETKWPPIGQFADIDGTRMHYVDVPIGENGDLPPIVFLHGSNGNLRDQMSAMRALFEGRGRLIFLDRPGHGYSNRKSKAYSDPSLQAQVVAGLLDYLNIERAIICGHSVGSATTVAFGVHYPEKTSGLLFLAPATHPWPSGVDWYYKLANKPVIGKIFSYLLAPTLGWMKYEGGITSVFAPNPLPTDYAAQSGTLMAMRGRQFHNNSLDVAKLNSYVLKLSPRYPEITVPTVVITGDSDDIVMAEIHSDGLLRDIKGAKLVTLKGVGHKPDYLAPQEIVKAIEWISTKTK